MIITFTFVDNNPYKLSFRLKYNGELGSKLKIINDKFNFDYIELIVNLDNLLYPFFPPSIQYSKPYMSPVVIQNLNDISFIDYKKWNSNITLEWMITQIAESFEEYFNKYIDINTNEYNEDGNIEKSNFNTFNIVVIKKYEDFNIKFELPDFYKQK